MIDRLTTALADRYRVERELGAGGMATVYLAHDLKHDREVAIKVLHPELGAALGGERFLAEIKTTAKLQHPHILPLLDSGDADGLLFYVMPLVDGETLRARLDRERQLPLDDAIRIATETAGALDYAHRHGVIHRDIKPENILLHDGRAVVADFGIALAVSAASGPRMTQTGLSLGTPQYMAPEQAMGEKQIDARADVYALGAVLYELLTGEPPFTGATVQAIVAKVLTEKPMSPSAVRDTIPQHVEATLLKALAKLPADRFATPAQFADALARPEVTAGIRAAAASTAARQAVGGARGTWHRLAGAPVPWTLAAVATAVAAAGWWRGGTSSPSPLPIVKAHVPALSGVTPTIIAVGNLFTISHDGSRLAFTGIDSTRLPKIFTQSLDQFVVTPLPGTQFAVGSFFSPDGGSLGFVRGTGLWTVSLAGGAPRPVCDAAVVRGASWGADSMIVYSGEGALYRVRASGGKPELLAAPPRDGVVYRNPSHASDRVVLFDITGDSASGVAALSLDDKRITRFGIPGIKPAYVTGGILAYVMLDGSVWGVDFLLDRLKVTGAPRLITDRVAAGSVTPRIHIAPNGTLVFISGDAISSRELNLVDRTGRARPAGSVRQAYRYPRFSPDGRRVVVGVSGSAGPASGDIWLLSLDAGTMVRLTSDTLNYQPEWDPDGRSIVYVKREPASGALYRVPVDGSGPSVRLLARQRSIWESRITPDRRTLVFREDGATTARDIFATPLDSPQVVRPLLTSPFDERGITLSPDGRWLGYTSNETGTTELYIRRLEPVSPRWRVSRNGGTEPRWARTGELFFRNGDSVYVSRIELAAEPRIGAPVALFGGQYESSAFEPLWDVSPDARQFVFVKSPDGGAMQMVLLLNWAEHWRAARK